MIKGIKWSLLLILMVQYNTIWAANTHGSIKTHRESRFQEAYDQIHAQEPDYPKALKLLQQNLSAYPKAKARDYEYAWALFCAAQIRQYETVETYYQIMLQNYYGMQSESEESGEARFAVGAIRSWGGILKKVRDLLSEDPEAEKLLTDLRKLDKAAHQKFVNETWVLIKQVQNGDRQAARKLESIRYQSILVKLVQNGSMAAGKLIIPPMQD